MRTMFASHQLNPSKKKFQKPNILRRKSKVSVQKSDPSHVNTVSHIVNSVPQRESIKGKPIRLHVEIARPEITNSFQNIEEDVKKYIVASNITEETELCNKNFDNNINNVIFENNIQSNTSENYGQSLLNVESFLNDTVHQDESKLLQTKDAQGKEYWCLQLVNDSKGIVLTTVPDDGSQLSYVDEKPDLSDAVPSTALSSVQHATLSSSNNVSSTVSSSDNIFCDSRSRVITFKCDEPNCKKGFFNELKLKKHNVTHNNNKSKANKISEVPEECPVKKLNENGIEEPCGRIFLTREDLLKHLNEDPTTDNGVYSRCAACGVMSLCDSEASGAVETEDTCAQSRSTRGPLTCSWPGCGRVFRQPCRLREHARAHTGDRPYPCLFPNCGWSFRSASKLLRHARRHTGDRRHTCASCGRAFLRREHLREHCARTHPDSAQAATREPSAPLTLRVCTYPDCSETFRSASARYVHIRKVHKKNDSTTNTKRSRSNILVVKDIKSEPGNLDPSATVTETVLAERSIMEEMQMETANEARGEERSGEECAVDGEEWHSARTHCTWPLAARRRSFYEQTLDSAYVLEDDVPVEQSESSESNIYTIRSDLFLHGNVLINEDSEFVVSREYLGRPSSTVPEGVETEETRDHTGTTHTLDTGLDLIDAHPTIDLMQEELMYADTAVDESSFRVFFT